MGEPSLPAAAQVLGGDSPLLPVFPQHRHPASLPRHGQTMTVHARKVETTFGLNDSAASENNNSFDTPPASEAHHSPHIGAFVPYRETSKPFEMSDFYKYSTKFRKTSASSLTADSDSPQLPGSQSPRSGSASQR